MLFALTLSVLTVRVIYSVGRLQKSTLADVPFPYAALFRGLGAFSHVSCETGIGNPAGELIELAHERGVPVLVDGAQSIGSLDVDFAALGADFMTGKIGRANV